MALLTIETQRREELRDITEEVGAVVHDSGARGGLCVLFSPHTTCGVTVNEGWDPDVVADVVRHLGRLVPHHGDWRHAEGNSDAHLKTMLVGADATLPVEAGELALGRWQRIFLCEFDGPRRRQLRVTIVAA